MLVALLKRVLDSFLFFSKGYHVSNINERGILTLMLSNGLARLYKRAHEFLNIHFRPYSVLLSPSDSFTRKLENICLRLRIYY